MPPALRPKNLLAAALLSTIALAASAQDREQQRILEEHRRGLEAGGRQVEDGAARAGSGDFEDALHGMAEAAEGFCMAMEANAKGFGELGVDFGALLGQAAGAGNAARAKQAAELCAQRPGAANSFALAGCADIVVGGTTTLSARPGEGSFRFSASQPGVLRIDARGPAATLTGLKPGIVTLKAERSGKAGNASASEVVHCLEVRSINQGQPLRIGMYDAKGRRIAAVAVPVDVLPRAAARRVLYRPADDLLDARGDAEGRLHLHARAPGKTTVQAMTACDQPSGAPLQVEIVPCTDEVREQLRAEQQQLLRRRDNVLRRIADLLGDPEFERATREFSEHTIELATKLAELAISGAGAGTAANSVLGHTAAQAKEAQELLDTLAEAANAEGHLDKVLQADAAGLPDAIIGAAGDAGGNMADVGMELATKNAKRAALKRIGAAGAPGIAKTAYEAGAAARAVAQDLGTAYGTAEELAELDQHLDAIVKELEELWRRMELCKQRGEARGPEPAPPAASGRAPGKAPGGGRRTASGAPLHDVPTAPPMEVVEVAEDAGSAGADRAPAGGGDDAGDEGGGDPETVAPPHRPPGSPASVPAMGLYARERQCPGWQSVAARQDGVFTALGHNIGALRGFYDDRQAQLLDPLAAQLEDTAEAMRLVVAAAGQADAQADVSYSRASALLARHDPARLRQAGPELDALAVQSQACSGLLRDSFEVKVEELRMRF